MAGKSVSEIDFFFVSDSQIHLEISCVTCKSNKAIEDHHVQWAFDAMAIFNYGRVNPQYSLHIPCTFRQYYVISLQNLIVYG